MKILKVRKADDSKDAYKGLDRLYDANSILKEALQFLKKAEFKDAGSAKSFTGDVEEALSKVEKSCKDIRYLLKNGL